jgi:hypothetical protein
VRERVGEFQLIKSSLYTYSHAVPFKQANTVILDFGLIIIIITFFFFFSSLTAHPGGTRRQSFSGGAQANIVSS